MVMKSTGVQNGLRKHEQKAVQAEPNIIKLQDFAFLPMPFFKSRYKNSFIQLYLNRTSKNFKH